jgi:putative transcription antitermination factor YqgF
MMARRLWVWCGQQERQDRHQRFPADDIRETTLQHSSFDVTAQKLKALAEEYEVHEIIVGNPMHMDGRPAEGEKVMKFGRKLGNALQLPVVFWDERLTSVTAEDTPVGLNWRERRKTCR